MNVDFVLKVTSLHISNKTNGIVNWSLVIFVSRYTRATREQNLYFDSSSENPTSYVSKVIVTLTFSYYTVREMQ